jgi:hypothetical protein
VGTLSVCQARIGGVHTRPRKTHTAPPTLCGHARHQGRDDNDPDGHEGAVDDERRGLRLAHLCSFSFLFLFHFFLTPICRARTLALKPPLPLQLMPSPRRSRGCANDNSCTTVREGDNPQATRRLNHATPFENDRHAAPHPRKRAGLWPRDDIPQCEDETTQHRSKTTATQRHAHALLRFGSYSLV